MSSLITVKGLQEDINALGQAPTGIFASLAGQMSAALFDMKADFANKPDQAPPRNPKRRYVRGSGMMYVPTGKIYRNTSQQYSKSISLQVTQPTGTSVEGKIDFGATYSGYLRGFYGNNLNVPAWMHIDTWDSTNTIVERNLPTVAARLNAAVSDWTKANGL